MQFQGSDKSVKSNFVINEDTLKGKWKEIKGGVQKMWGNLTDDELEKSKGDLNTLTGVIQQRYGESKEAVQTKLNDYFSSEWSDVKKGIAHGSEKLKEAVSQTNKDIKKKM